MFRGGCNGICDSFGTPLLYFDFGGGIGRNSFTYLNKHKFCFSNTPPIILSHWDKDHWVSAEIDEDSLNTNWIVPRQKLGVSHLKLAVKLYKKGNLYIWPSYLKSMRSKAGMLIKNTGRSINDSGISLVSRIKYQGSYFTTLFPGDSKYKHIPSINKMKFNGLIATHHGGHYRSDIHIPFAKRSNRIVYSYGVNNTFDHPRTPTVNKHVNANWDNRLNTINGNIMLGPKIKTRIPTQPCRNTMCTLQITQN